MALGYDKGKYDLLASIDTTTPGSPAHLDSNAIVAEGIYLEHRATKERFFFMAYAGLWANFANASTKSWFQSILSDISDNHPSDKVILIFPVSKSPANMEPYLADTCNFDELHYATNVTDFAVFASHGQFSLSSVQSVVDSAVSTIEEGLFTLGYNSQGAATFNVRFLDKDGVTVIDEVTVAGGAAVTPPATLPSHEGEHFVCWMLGESVYDITAAVTSDLTLVASYASSINDGVWEIGSYDEFAAAITEESPAGARYRLTADINLAPWCAVDFRGILDGDGHTLEGLGSPLFNTISGGRVQNLVIASSAVEEEEKGGSIGFIARTRECGASADVTVSELEASLLQMQKVFRASADKIDGIIDKVEAVDAEDRLAVLIDLLGGDPGAYAEFFSSLVDVDVEEVYSVASYGAAMAPFYSVLAIWVGGVILVSILKTHIDRKKFPEATEAQAFFGRFLLFFLVGQMQAAVIVAGDIFLLNCQPVHPWLMWISAAVTSFVFELFIYALTISFGDIGKAIVVVIMVLQIAGSASVPAATARTWRTAERWTSVRLSASSPRRPSVNLVPS